MKRIYVIKWYPTKEIKYGGSPLTRSTLVSLDTAIGDTGVDAKKALSIFSARCGGLNKNTIICIKECNEDGVQIGEDITPADDSSVIPAGR